MIYQVKKVPSGIGARIDQVQATNKQLMLMEEFLRHGHRIYREAGIAERLCEGEERKFQTPGIAFAVFNQLLIFLWLKTIKPMGTKVPFSNTVDTLWHEFMLFSEHYVEFCQLTAGYYLHHTPITSVNREVLENMPLWLASRDKVGSFINNHPFFNPLLWPAKILPSPQETSEADLV